MSGSSKQATSATQSEHEMNSPPPVESEATIPPSGPVPPMLHQYIRLLRATGFRREVPSPSDLDNLPPGTVIVDHSRDAKMSQRKRSKRHIDPSTTSTSRSNRRVPRGN